VKILCLTSHDLNAPDYGAVLRARNVFRLLSRIGEVRVVLAGRYENAIKKAVSPQAGFELLDRIYFPPTQKRPLADRLRHELDSRFLNLEWRQAAASHRERLQNLIAGHDLVWIHDLAVANGFSIWRWPKTILDMDDVPSSFHRSHFGRACGPREKFLACREMLLWRRHEKHLAKRFDAICVCSAPDRLKLGGSKNVFVLPNGFVAPEKEPRRNPVVPPQIGFVGTFKYRPNEQGVKWFIEKVWPTILKKFPQARLRLAGEGGEKFSSSQNVDASGWVADMESEMANWSLAIVPVLAGAGTRIKILDAFSRKCPVVSTHLGAYGHDVENGRELLLADSPNNFAENCLRILKNPLEGGRLAKNAWQKFLNDCTWDSQAGRVAEIIENVLGRNPTPRPRQNISEKKFVPAGAFQFSKESKIN
jgi:glycosyltransferase involved in cell wall biosynthesis